MTVTRRAVRDRINSTTKISHTVTENSVNADVLWRCAGAPCGKGTILHYGVKEIEQNKIVFASTVYYYSNICQNSAYFAKHSIPHVEETYATLFCVMTARSIS